MVSIGMLILLLIPLVLCTNDGFLKLSNVENAQRLSNCSNFTGFSDGFLETSDNTLITFISPRHFVTDFRILNYHSLECATHGDIVTSLMKTKSNLAVKMIGKCTSEPMGAILGDSHKEYQDSNKKWFCIRNEKIKNHESVKIVTDLKKTTPGTVVGCKTSKEDVFCVKAKEGIQGFVMSETNEKYQLIGTIIGPTEDDKKVLEVFFLHNHLKNLCDTAGICDGDLETTPKLEETTTEPITSTEKNNK